MKRHFTRSANPRKKFEVPPSLPQAFLDLTGVDKLRMMNRAELNRAYLEYMDKNAEEKSPPVVLPSD
jgi:hypothetical protein